MIPLTELPATDGVYVLPPEFWPKVDKAGPVPTHAPHLGPCWLWAGGHNGDGYAQVSLDGRVLLVHRAIFEALVGPIPADLEMDHLCRVRACINPAHVEPVTRSANQRRGYQARGLKLTCKQGHPFTPENTEHNGKQRICKTCRRARSRAYMRRVRAARRGV